MRWSMEAGQHQVVTLKTMTMIMIVVTGVLEMKTAAEPYSADEAVTAEAGGTRWPTERRPASVI